MKKNYFILKREQKAGKTLGQGGAPTANGVESSNAYDYEEALSIAE